MQNAEAQYLHSRPSREGKRTRLTNVLVARKQMFKGMYVTLFVHTN
jgi:hypothetical protein